jgi:hypothetical protein
MQKVVGSSPIIRSPGSPAYAGFSCLRRGEQDSQELLGEWFAERRLDALAGGRRVGIKAAHVRIE